MRCPRLLAPRPGRRPAGCRMILRSGFCARTPPARPRLAYGHAVMKNTRGTQTPGALVGVAPKHMRQAADQRQPLSPKSPHSKTTCRWGGACGIALHRESSAHKATAEFQGAADRSPCHPKAVAGGMVRTGRLVCNRPLGVRVGAISHCRLSFSVCSGRCEVGVEAGVWGAGADDFGKQGSSCWAGVPDRGPVRWGWATVGDGGWAR